MGSSWLTRLSALANQIGLLSAGFNLESYRITFQNRVFRGSLIASVRRVATGISLSLFHVPPAGYPLSQEEKDFSGRTAYAWAFVFTMAGHRNSWFDALI